MKPTDKKAIQLVVEDKVTISWRSDTLRDGVPEAAQGTVEGKHGLYKVAYSPAGRMCGCLASANGRDCSHGKGLALAVLVEAQKDWEALASDWKAVGDDMRRAILAEVHKR